jgi:phage terminase large subunit-like protein
MDADPWIEETWKLANPALGDFMNTSIVREMANTAKSMPSAEASFRNLILNQRVDAAAGFIPPEVWKACGGEPDLSLFEDRPVYAGLDLSAKNDLTALVAVCEDGDGFWHVMPEFWCPREGIRERSERDRVPYDMWARQGCLNATPGRVIDYEFVAREIQRLHERMYIEALEFDRWRIGDLMRELRSIGVDAWIDGQDEPISGGLRLVQHGQGFRDMNPAVERLEDLLAEGRLRHGMHPVLTMCASNVRVQQDPSGNRKFDKIKSTGRIDGIVALAMALNGAGHGADDDAGGFFVEAW